MRHLKVNSQKEPAGRRTIGTRNSKEVASKNVQNDRNNIGKRIATGTMPRTRRSVALANTPSTTVKTTSVTSSNLNRIPKIQNGNDQPRNRGEMESLLKKRNEVMPCMTGLDRVVNWKSSTQYAVVGYYKNEVVVSPHKQTVQRSSIQERISYDKVSSSSTFGRHSPSSYDFKVPSTIQRNDNSVELIDLTDDASESNTSSITTTQEELYSYLGVVTKSQTNKVEAETENKTVKRSSLRVKVKQIALRNQEIYNQLENSRKLEAAANNAQSLVRYNGHRIEQSSVQVRRDNGVPRLNHYSSRQQQYTQSTYKSTTLVNNTTSSQPSRNNYRTVETNRVNHQQYRTSHQMVPYPFQSSSRVRNSTNKCTVMERFVYKSEQGRDSIPIQVNVDKYKTSNATTTTTVNRLTNGVPQIGIRTTKIGEGSPTRKPETVPSSRDSRPPQITAGIKRKAMEQWIELSSSHPTSANHLQSKSENSSASFTSFHHQNTTTTTNISTHRKIQKVDVSTVQTHFVKNVGASNAFQTISQANAGTSNSSPQRKMPINPNKSHLQSRAIQNVGAVNALPLQKSIQQNCQTKNTSSPGVNHMKSASIQPPPLNIRPSNALALQTCSQKNIGNNNRVSKRRLSPRLSSEVKKAIIHESQSLQNVVVSNVIVPRKTQNVNSNSAPTGKGYSAHSTDKCNISTMHMSPQKKVNVSPPKLSDYDARVSSSSTPVLQNIAVSNVSSLQTSSQQYISSNGNDVTIEVTVHSNFKSKRESSMQMRTLQNVETGSSSEKNSQHNIDNKNVVTRGMVKNIDSDNVPSSVQSMQMHPIQNIAISNSASQTNCQQNINLSSLKNEQMVLLLPTSSMETIKTFQPPVFDIESEIEMASTDLNENVASDNKPDIPMDLSLPIIDVQAAKRDSKTYSIDDDIKPCLTITPIGCENSVIESECNESKLFAVPENLSSNFLQTNDGDALSVLSFDDQFVVIQEKLISVWTLPSELFSIFGVEQQYVCIGKIERYNCDIEIDMPYQHRLLVVDNKTFYVELRAKKLSGTYTRESLMSIYMTLYSLNDQQELTLRHIECDRVHGSIASIRWTILPKTRSFVISWCELITNVRKYILNENMLNLESVLIFPGCRETLKKVQFYENDTVIAFGHSTITIWDSRSGDITCKIDTNTPIGDNLHFFSLNENFLPCINLRSNVYESAKVRQKLVNLKFCITRPSKRSNYFISTDGLKCIQGHYHHSSESADFCATLFVDVPFKTEKALFLVQSCTDPAGNGQLIRLLAINMNKNYSWKVICTHKMPTDGAKITSMATITNHFITFYENGQSFLLNLYNPRQFVVHSSEAKGFKHFVTNGKVVAIAYNQLMAKTFVDHFFG